MTPDFKAIGAEIGALVQEKNAAYGDSFAKSGDFLRLLYPDGIRPEQYGDALLIVRVFDKLMRVATRKDAFGESPWRDCAGYSILGVANDRRKAAIAESGHGDAASVSFCGCVCRAKDGAYTMTYCDKHFPKGVKPGDLVAASIPYHYSPPEDPS